MKTLLLAIGVVLLFLSIAVAINFANLLFRGFAPLVLSRKIALKAILDTIHPTPGQVLYELGSGSARFLQMVEKKFPDTTFIGLEYSLFPFLFSRLTLWFKKSKIQIRRENIFYSDLHNADIIFCYLLPGMMPVLGTKVRSECKPGTLFVSYMFSVPNWQPKQTIRQHGGVIYFYKV
ncbi:MAG: hypothetical protein A3J66_03715 [Candidatus Magasanikbacteria bacterium RIFCSPHIGHO2_02_FULL_47_14]|uniref:Uncharacterized protein n=1 Tax=Candidatus Magasanikbacteria bacterium RIFCSPHIGHO2_02_FULL_47_14 TaxID=1798680 RepID=A0A1F6M7B6_9BACT|nr:MAG: hypothetical protein A3J66_03715 [Candidatus Magasanikbacteria bacterium RIFCSPHIGHO2_02_FULL_47_14]